MITIQVNYEQKSLESETSLEVLLSELSISPQGIAVAINNQIITKNSWSETALKENDNVTIIKATQGG